MTETQFKALTILKDTTWGKGYSAAGFAEKMWPDSNMHKSSKNTGNGSCRGKAAWLCGGSYLAKLRKKGWIAVYGEFLNRFYLSFDGRKALEEKIKEKASMP